MAIATIKLAKRASSICSRALLEQLPRAEGDSKNLLRVDDTRPKRGPVAFEDLTGSQVTFEIEMIVN